METFAPNPKDSKYILTWEETHLRIEQFILDPIYAACKRTDPKVFGIPRGGTIIAAMMDSPVSTPMEAEYIVDDIIDTGRTAREWSDKFNLPVLAIIDRISRPADAALGWVVFPWEIFTPEVAGPTENVIRLLEFIGEDPKREGLLDTPKRVVKALAEMTGGYKMQLGEVVKTFKAESDEMVILTGIRFSSLCEHHMLPFSGVASIGYLPGETILGISKLARLVNMFAHRLQIQERLTSEIANAIQTAIKPKGVGVVMEAHHNCMGCRGVRQPDARMITSAMLGVFRDRPEARAEFLKLVQQGR